MKKSKKGIILFILILLSFAPSFIYQVVADDRSEARKELYDLLENRQKLFDDYNQSLKKKSGFFGNRTKNDMRQSHATLQDIVEIDNHIMHSLERVIDRKNYEKTSMTFDASTYQDKINNLTNVNEVTLKQNESLSVEKKQLNTQVIKMKFYFIILFFIIAGLLYLLYRKK